jgi:hypothetical protein
MPGQELKITIDTAPALAALERVQRLGEARPDIRERAEGLGAFTATVECFEPITKPDALCLVVRPTKHFCEALARAETAAATERRIAALERAVEALRARGNPG